MIGEALAYHDRGLSIMPIGADKHPCVKWSRLQTDRPTESEIRRWWARWPDANVGIITGGLSGVVAADFDKPDAERRYALPPTAVTQTKRGFHYYFKHPGGYVPTVTKLADGLDLKADGGYVVCPPSIHPSGQRYSWIDGLSLFEHEPAPCPEWLLALARTHKAKRTERRLASRNIPTSLPSEGRIEAATLALYDADLKFVSAASALMGIPADALNGTPFACILPGHTDRHPSASLYKTYDGKVMYRDWHSASGYEWYTLSEVRASIAYGRALKLTPSEHAVWHLRLLAETGYALQAEVDMPECPAGCRQSVRKVYDGIRLLFGCRWLYDYGKPAPLAWTFMAAWCGGLSERHTGLAIHELLKKGVIQIVGVHRRTKLFLPGKGGG